MLLICHPVGAGTLNGSNGYKHRAPNGATFEAKLSFVKRRNAVAVRSTGQY